MASPNPAKRRKLDDVANTLKKPFRSPMRAPKPQQTPLKENATKANVVPRSYLPSILAHTIEPACPARESASVQTPLQHVKPKSPITTSIPKRQWCASKVADPEIRAAQRAISSLELQLKKVKLDIDTLNQAAELSNSHTDSDLGELTEKWRLTTQAVAEELFTQVKERVQRMGGVAAWREMEKRKFERQNGLGEFAQPREESDYEDCEFDSEGEELPEKEQAYRKKMKRQAKQEAMDAADTPDAPEIEPGRGKREVWQEQGQDDDTFTMDMMLRSLNINLKLIGFDKEMQKWT